MTSAASTGATVAPLPTMPESPAGQGIVCQPAPTSGVVVSLLSDEQREQAIRETADALQAAMTRWADTGCFAALGDSHRHLARFEALINGRSAAQVQRMERERGLL